MRFFYYNYFDFLVYQELIMNQEKKERLNLATKKYPQLKVNFIESQLISYQDFLENGIEELFNEINPIEDYTRESWELRFEDVEWGKEDNISMREAQKLSLSFDRPLHINTKLINKKTGEIKKQKIFVADVPMMSTRASFIVNGNERVVVMQIVRAEGILFVTGKIPGSTIQTFTVKLMPMRGKWFDFEINKSGVMMVKLLDKRPKVLLTTLLRAIGWSTNEEIHKALDEADNKGDISYLNRTLKKDSTTNQDEALLEIFKKIRPEDSINLENAKDFIDNLFFKKRRFYLGKIGRYQMNKKMGISNDFGPEDYTLKPEDLLYIAKSLILLNNRTIAVDDIDSLENRRIRGVGELVGEKIRIGIARMEKNIRDRMSTYSTEDLITPSLVVNTKPVIASINQFFGSSAVSRYMDQENILSELETKRRITAGGGGSKGLTKERATFSVRDAHSSHYARLCPVATPEGPSIGIVSHMSVYARINDFGFLEAPYFKVLSNINMSEVKSKQLLGKTIRENILDSRGKIFIKKGTVLSKPIVDKLLKRRIKNIKVEPVVTDEIVYLSADVEAKAKIGPATVKQDAKGNIKDATVFVRNEGNFMKVHPYELDYIDISPGEIAGLGLSLVPFCYNDDPTRTLMASNMQRQAVPLITTEAPIVGTGFEKIIGLSSGRVVLAENDGEVIASDARHITIKYSDKQKVDYEIEKFVKTNQNTCFSQKPLVQIGQKLKKGDLIIDGPSMDNGELALGKNLQAAYMTFDGMNYEDSIIISEKLVADDKLTSIHVKEYVQDIRETKLGNEQITRDIPNIGEYLLRNLDETGIVRVGAAVNTQDILVGIIAPKGETELSAEEKLLRAIFGEYARDVRDNSLKMPHGDKGIVIDVQTLDKSKGDKLNPGVLRQVKVWVASTHKIAVGDKLTGLHGDKGVISMVLPVEEMPYLEDGTPIDLILTPMFVKRMNLGQIREMEVAGLANKLGIHVEVPPFTDADLDKLYKLAKEKKITINQKETLFDGRTGKPFKQKILVGSRYFLKLNHLSSDKIHARSTGSYTLVTQQPLGGKAQFGGQRFGEMEVWALEAHAAVHNLQELLTIKSDDVVGRAAAYKSIIQGISIEAPNIPESFKVLISELRALGLDLEMIEPDQDDVDESEIVEGVLESTTNPESMLV